MRLSDTNEYTGRWLKWMGKSDKQKSVRMALKAEDCLVTPETHYLSLENKIQKIVNHNFM